MTSCLFTCQLRDLSQNFPRRTPPPPTDNCVFVLRTVKKILITAISENSSFLAKSLVVGSGSVALAEINVYRLSRIGSEPHHHSKINTSRKVSQNKKPYMSEGGRTHTVGSVRTLGCVLGVDVQVLQQNRLQNTNIRIMCLYRGWGQVHCPNKYIYFPMAKYENFQTAKYSLSNTNFKTLIYAAIHML